MVILVAVSTLLEISFVRSFGGWLSRKLAVDIIGDGDLGVITVEDEILCFFFVWTPIPLRS